MDPRIARLRPDAVLHEVARRYGVAPSDLRRFASSESHRYAFERGRARRVLRFGHSLRRDEVMIEPEIDGIEHLAAEGVPVARSVRSDAGRRVEAIDDGRGGRFLATAFERANGRPVNGTWTPATRPAFGRQLGRMHLMAGRYRPAVGVGPDTFLAYVTEVLRGYRTVRPFDPAWLPWLPAFLEMAEIFTYAVVSRDAPGDAAGTRWRDRFLRERRGRIEQGIPVVDIDVASFGAAE